MRKVVLFLVLGFVAVVVVGAIYLQAQARKAQAGKAAVDRATVDRGELVFKVIETGTLDAVRFVDVRTRANGRLKDLKVKEGDMVNVGDPIATIDPLETQLRVQQDTAQRNGAQSGVARTAIEIEQRRVSAKAAYDQAVARLAQLKKELEVQPTLTKTSITQAQAAYNSASQDRDRLLTVTHPNQRTAADTEISDALVAYETADADFKRINDLLARGYVAQLALDNARLRMETARNRLSKSRSDRQRLDGQQVLESLSAEDNVKSSKAALERAQANRIQDDTKRQEVLSAEAGVRQANAALRDVQVLQQTLAQGKSSVMQLQSVLADSQRQLRETDVRAPIGGIVSKKYIEEGDMVTGLSAFSQGTAIVRVEDRSALRVKLDINEIDVARLHLGMRATVEVDAFPDKSYSGQVSKIAPASNAMQAAQSSGSAGAPADAVVKYQVEILLDETDPKLRSGMSAKCTFETLNRQNVLRAPVEYVGKDADGDFVLIAPPKGSKEKPKRVSVKLGAKTGAYAEIQAGVKEGDMLALPEFKGPSRKGFFSGPGDDQQQDSQSDSKTKGGSSGKGK